MQEAAAAAELQSLKGSNASCSRDQLARTREFRQEQKLRAEEAARIEKLCQLQALLFIV